MTQNPQLATKSVAAFILALLSVLFIGFASGPAYAADDASIDFVEPGPGVAKILVSIPGTEKIDLGSVKVTIGDDKVDATAVNAATADVKRTAILAIDTSNSMRGARITQAKAAAKVFLDSVPDDVQVGIVTFDNGVAVQQPPSLDRAASAKIIDGLTLRLNTALYDGVIKSVDVAKQGGNGQKQILVISDGEDTTTTPLADVIKVLAANDVKVDVVAVQQKGAALAKLTEIAQAGKGDILTADDPTELSTKFGAEAQALSRQVLVTADVPGTQQAFSASVTVAIDAGDKTYSSSAFVPVRAALAPGQLDNKPVPVKKANLSIPRNVMLGAIAAIGLGSIALIFALGSANPNRNKPASVQEQIQAYGANAKLPKARKDPNEAQSPIDAARAAAESMLANNRSLEARIETRLETAGIALRASEWILIHAGIAIGASLVGLLLGGGNPLLIVLFLFLGIALPWVYLGRKRARRLKAFDSSLADTLQLMSGSLSAGLSLAQSIDTIVREGQEPITSEFKRVIVESRLGVSLEDAMEGVAERMNSKDFEWVVMAIRIQREVGGNLAELLLTVAATLREREYLRRHVHALSAEGRLSCYVLGGLPPLFLLYLTLTKGDYVRPLYTTPIGWVLCGGMVILLSVGIFWMSKVSKVDI